MFIKKLAKRIDLFLYCGRIVLLSEDESGMSRSFVCIWRDRMHKNGQNKSISEIIYPIAKPIAENLGLEIWDIKLVKEGPNQYLRIFIDSKNGVTLEDCENVSHALDSPLDELDPIPDSYFLEVCSPGIERELSKDEHLEKFTGHNIKIRLIRANEDNKKEICGILKSFDKHSIEIENIKDDSPPAIFKITRKNISHINLQDSE